MLKNSLRGGYDVVLNGRTHHEELLAITKELEEKYSIQSLVCMGDIANEDDVKGMLDEVKNKFDRIDVLVNNAAIVYDMEIEERPISLFEETMHNNVTGT